MPWLLCDFGNVLAFSPTPEDIGAMIRLAECDPSILEATYWASQVPYDPNVDLRGFWAGMTKNPDAVDQLVAMDLAAWMRPKSDVVEAVESAQQRGFRLALLSNAPAEFRDAFASCDWLKNFERIFVGCDIGAKPAADAYLRAARELGSDPSEIIFVDDRPENIDGASAVGMNAILFTDARQIDALHPSRVMDDPMLRTAD